MRVQGDPKGFYAQLGISPSASAEEIKSAYRRLAKKLHPDVNVVASAKAQFQAVTEAYNVLSSPELRRAYDAVQYSNPDPRPERNEIDPICCSHCGKITAQPRSIVFFRVISLVFLTTKTPIQGTFCSACATKLGLLASAITGLLGWWGFPWGPIWTISSICSNAAGGRRSQEIDEKLTWYNALAFLSHGKLAISHALAQKLRHAKSTEIASNAEKLINQLRAVGVPITSPSLKNPWSNHFVAAAHIGLLLLIPGAIGLAVAYDDLTKNSTGARQPRPSFRQNYANTPDLSKYAVVPSQPSQAPSPLRTCATPPHNGQVLTRNVAPNAQGHSIEIKNGSSANAIIKIRDDTTGALKLSFFVERGNSAFASNLPDGIYRIQYAFGGQFGIDCRTFIKVTSASQFPYLETFTTRHARTEVITARLSYTLYSVPGGNIRPQSLDLAAFNAD